MKRINYYLNQIREFGLFFTIVMRMNRSEKKRGVKYVYNYIFDEMRDIVEKYKKIEDFFVESPDKSKERIQLWTCWWQGESAMPDVLKMCLNSIRESLDEKVYDLKVIDNTNMHNFVSLPEFILKKYELGKISMTHLSDVYRMTLLAERGGVWIDPGHYFVRSGDFGFVKSDFFVRKRKNNVENSSVAQGRWSGNFMIANKKNILCSFIKECLWRYWENHNIMIHYFLIDIIINIAYDNVSSIRKAIDNVPYTNPNVYWLQEHLNEKWDCELFETMCKDTHIFKLTQKVPVKKYDGERETFYGHLLKMNKL